MDTHRLQTIAAVLLFVLCGLVACRPQYQVPSDVLRIHMGSEPATLNHITGTDAYTSLVNHFIYDSLIDRDKDSLEFVPKMASHWTVSEDKKTYTFYLKKGIRWHDGKPFTADDVVYAYQLIQNPKVNAPHIRVYYKDVEEVVKIDDHTVQCRYSKIYFMALSFCGGIPIVPKHLVEGFSDFDGVSISRYPVGTGPYKFKEWQTNNKIVLERNEDYWGEKPDIRVIEFQLVSDPAVALQILKKGDIDYLTLTPIQWAKQTGSKKFHERFKKFLYPSGGYSYVGWNNEHKIFHDPLVRRAMTHLVPRREIIDKINFGIGKIITGPFFPFGKQYNTKIEPLKRDVGEARSLLERAGWKDSNGDGWLDKDGQVFRFEFLYPSASKTSERLSTIFKEDLKKVGVDMSITRMEWAAFLNRIQKKDFEATSLAWASPFESDPYQVWHISQADVAGSSNFISYRNQNVSRLIEEARVEFDPTLRNALYWKIHYMIHRDQPYTFLYNTPAIVAVSKRFDNIKLHKTGLDVLEWKVRAD